MLILLSFFSKAVQSNPSGVYKGIARNYHKPDGDDKETEFDR